MTDHNPEPTATLEILNYERLKAKDHNETQKLIAVCSGIGIFFLDLQSSSMKKPLSKLQSIVAAQRMFFAQTSESKLVYSNDLPDQGYASYPCP
jgi:isopenicillin N synthase-like dioxygenase